MIWRTTAFLWAGRFVHDHDIAGRQGRQQALPDVFDKDRTGHGAVDDEGRGDRRRGASRRRRFIVFQWPKAPGRQHAGARLARPRKPGHGGVGAGFVDEHSAALDRDRVAQRSRPRAPRRRQAALARWRARFF